MDRHTWMYIKPSTTTIVSKKRLKILSEMYAVTVGQYGSNVRKTTLIIPLPYLLI